MKKYSFLNQKKINTIEEIKEYIFKNYMDFFNKRRNPVVQLHWPSLILDKLYKEAKKYNKARTVVVEPKAGVRSYPDGWQEILLDDIELIKKLLSEIINNLSKKELTMAYINVIFDSLDDDIHIPDYLLDVVDIESNRDIGILQSAANRYKTAEFWKYKEEYDVLDEYFKNRKKIK